MQTTVMHHPLAFELLDAVPPARPFGRAFGQRRSPAIDGQADSANSAHRERSCLGSGYSQRT